MKSLWRSTEISILHGQSMEVFMESPWRLHGDSMENLWGLGGGVYGESMDANGNSMGLHITPWIPCKSPWISMDEIHSWKFMEVHGELRELHEDFLESSYIDI